MPSSYTGRTPCSLPDVGWRYSPLWPQASPADPTPATGKLGGVATEPEPLGDVSSKCICLAGVQWVDSNIYCATHRRDRLARCRSSAPPDQFRPAQYRHGREDAHFSHQHADSCTWQFIYAVSAMRVVVPYTDTSLTYLFTAF